jgi:hypothetical protein
MLYTFSLPAKADKVPARPDWLHEVKYDDLPDDAYQHIRVPAGTREPVDQSWEPVELVWFLNASWKRRQAAGLPASGFVGGSCPATDCFWIWLRALRLQGDDFRCGAFDHGADMLAPQGDRGHDLRPVRSAIISTRHARLVGSDMAQDFIGDVGEHP